MVELLSGGASPCASTRTSGDKKSLNRCWRGSFFWGNLELKKSLKLITWSIPDWFFQVGTRQRKETFEENWNIKQSSSRMIEIFVSRSVSRFCLTTFWIFKANKPGIDAIISLLLDLEKNSLHSEFCFLSHRRLAALSLATVATCCKPSSGTGDVWVETSLSLGQGHTRQ